MDNTTNHSISDVSEAKLKLKGNIFVKTVVVVKAVSNLFMNKQTFFLLFAGGGGAAQPGMYPGQSDLSQEVPRPGGRKLAGEPAANLTLSLYSVICSYRCSF